jgi:hypothetical protein
MRAAIAMVTHGSTREDIRDQKKSDGPGKARARSYHFVYNPKDAPYKLAISFDKSRVNREELIGALKTVLKQLESGTLDLGKKR